MEPAITGSKAFLHMNEPAVASAHRRFGPVSATALNMSNMMGIGPFITIPALMSSLNGGGPQAMLGWLVALVITIPDGMIWSELGAAMPGAGGSYHYLREAFGPKTWGRLWAFLFIWQFILSGPLEIASGFIGFSQYLRYVWPDQTKTDAGLIIVAMGLLTILLLYRQIHSVKIITICLWIGALLTVGAVMVTGLPHFDSKIAFDFPDNAWHFGTGFVFGLGAASRIAVYDYLGYYDICYLGEEVDNPGRSIPRSVLWSLLLVAGIYLAINLSIIGVVSWRQFVPVSDPPAPVVSLLMEKIHGPGVAKVFTGMVLWTAMASVFALMLGYSRIPYAAARDGNFFSCFAAVHPVRGFPHRSLLVIGLVSIMCSFLDLLTVIDALLITRILVQFVGQAVGVALLRKRRPELVRPYKMWLYPLPALLALVGWVFLFATSDAKLIFQGLSFLLAGVVVFLVWSSMTRRWPFSTPIESK